MLPQHGFTGKASVVYFPHGTYVIRESILVSGVINLKGDCGGSYSGSVISQAGIGKSIFVLGPDTDGNSSGSHIDDLFLKIIQNSPTPIAAITAIPHKSNNSIYIRNCFIQAVGTNVYSIDMPRSDDIQISGCTFDTGTISIRLGSPNDGLIFGNTCTNTTIQNCTFYGIAKSSIKIVNATNTNIVGNRFYDGTKIYPNDTNVVIDIATGDLLDGNNFANNINIVSNTFSDCKTAVNIVSLAKKINIIGNVITKCTVSAITLFGDGILNNLIIQSNNISGNFLTAGAISSPTTGLTRSIIKDNIIQGNENGTDSTLPINIPDSRTAVNNVKENIIYGFSSANIIANPTQNIL